MARNRPLKVYRTSAGFHDAYVAAPSRKAALEAWGARNDLFAIGSAEVVTDPDLTAEPLARPGEVIKRSRGSLTEQLAALPKAKAARKASTAVTPPAKKSPPRPPPSRAGLEKAEADQRGFEEQAEAEEVVLREREAELRSERAALAARHAAQAEKLERRVNKAREKYERALSEWRKE